MRCQNCGAENEPGVRFCKRCGQEMRVSMEENPNRGTPQNTERNSKGSEDYTPITMWGYFGYQLLFGLPCVGFILLLVFSFGGTKNVNLRNFARSYFCYMIVIVVLLVILTLAGGGLSSLFTRSYY